MGKIQIDRALNCHCHHTFGATSDPRAAPAAARHAFQFRFLKLFQLQPLRNSPLSTISTFSRCTQCSYTKTFHYCHPTAVHLFLRIRNGKSCGRSCNSHTQTLQMLSGHCQLAKATDAQGLVLPTAKITSTPNSYFEDVNHL